MSVEFRTSPSPDCFIGTLSFGVMKNPIETSCCHHFDKALFLTARKINQSCPICRAENITFSVDKPKKSAIEVARATHHWSPFQDPPLLSADSPQPSRTRAYLYEPLYISAPDMYFASFAVSYGIRQGVDFGGCCKEVMQYLFNCCCVVSAIKSQSNSAASAASSERSVFSKTIFPKIGECLNFPTT